MTTFMDINQSCESFDDLPLEMKHEIFGYLDFESLKTSTLVSKSWNDAIATSSTFNAKTRLNIVVYKKEEVQLEKFWRCYQDVVIFFVNTEELFLNILDGIKSFGSHLITLDILSYRMSAKADAKLLNLLQHCTHLQSIQMALSNGNHKNNVRSKEIVKLPMLRSLKLEKMDWTLDHIESTELRKLNIHSDNGNNETIVKFINSQSKLSSLTCHYVSLDTEVEVLPKFQLNHIEAFHLSSKLSSNSIRNWEKLIHAAAPDASLEYSCDRDPGTFNHFMAIIGDISNVIRLCICVEDLLDVHKMGFESLNHITSLKFGASDDNCCCNDCMKFVEPFLMKFKNLDTIEIDELGENCESLYQSYGDVFIPIFAKLPSLKKLIISLDSICCIYYESMAIMPQITALHIGACLSNDFLSRHKEIMFFGKRHTTVRHVGIELADELQTVDLIIEKLAEAFPSAQTLEVTHGMGKKKSIRNRQ